MARRPYVRASQYAKFGTPARKAKSRAVIRASGGTPAPVIPSAILIDGFNSAASWVAGGGAAFELDTTNPQEGTGAIRLQLSTGASGATPLISKQPAEGNAALSALAGADLGTISWCWEPLNYSGDSQVAPVLQLGRGGTYYDPGLNLLAPTFMIGKTSEYWNGPRWSCYHVSEVAALMAAGAGQWDVRARLYNMSSADSAPYAPDIEYHAAYARSEGVAQFVPLFHDTENTTATFASPYMSQRGMVGTVSVAMDYVGVSDSLTLSQMNALKAGGWGFMMDSTSDDQPWTTKFTTPAQVVAEAQAMAAYMQANGFAFDNGDKHFNLAGIGSPPTSGDFVGSSDRFYYPLTTANVAGCTTTAGSPVITQGTDTPVTVGAAIVMAGLNTGTDRFRVLSKSGTSITVTKDGTNPANIPVTLAARPCWFRDNGHAMADRKIQIALQNAGFLSFQGVGGGLYPHRMGLDTQRWALPGQGFTNADPVAQGDDMIAMLDKAVLRGATFMPYMHRITPEGGSINIAEAAFARLIDRARYWMDLGKLQNKTYGQWWSAFRYATL